ncbi:hypothetical protein SAMN02745866_01736 [Alteromonadaceae bacterium Bs31]|nr:hypothetical protein SAMN02745866_01736 [Alteromonadaceae bacterium Bs31]
MLGKTAHTNKLAGWVKGATLIIAALLFVGCVDVEEDNSEVSAALKEQNQILREQQNQSTQETASVTLYGRVLDAASEQLVNDLSIRIKLGPDWQEALTFNNGEFRIPDLLPSSDFEMVISSTSGAFMDRLVYGSTQYSTVANSFQEISPVLVSPEKTYQFSVINTESNELVSGLEFRGHSYIGNGYSFEDYAHVSNYDATQGLYSISLPEHIWGSISADLDINGDSVTDFDEVSHGYRSSNRWVISNSELESFTQATLTPPEIETPVDITIRLSVLDGSALPLEGLEMLIDDRLNNGVSPTYDATTKQYVFNASIDNYLQILISAKEFEEDYYRSSTIRISLTDTSGQYSVSTDYGNSSNYYQVTDDDGDINLVYAPQAQSPSTSLKLVYGLENIESPNYEAKFFYSSPISVTEENITLVKKDQLSVTKGDDSPSDYVLPGTTYLEIADAPVSTDINVLLGDTLLSISPSVALEEGHTYRYSVGELTDTYNDLDVNINNDYMQFETPVVSPFNINEVRLDNNNYWTNNARIVALNSAGVPSSQAQYSSTPQLFFPPSIKGLQNFTMSQRVVTKNGVSETKFRSYNIVEEGEVKTYNKNYTVSLANNEDIEFDYCCYYSFDYSYGTSLPDTLWYKSSTNEYMNDNTASSSNSITFDFAYETKTGEVVTGSLTLPVL